MIKATITTPIPIDKFEAAFQKELRKGLEAIANDAYEFWRDEVGRHLHQTLKPYRDALHLPRKVDEDTFEIMLNHSEKRANWLIMAIECGYPSFDIKPGLLGSPSAERWSQFAKAHRPGSDKVGKFLDVPFRTKSRQQDKPDKFRRITEASGGWQHPGFSPKGGKRVIGPFRDKVKERIAKQAPKVLGPLLAQIRI